MSDIHGLVGAYAVDALDDVERRAFERHLADCETCRAEVAGLQEAASLLGATEATAPPAALRDRVLADIAAVRPLPPTVEPAVTPGGRRRFQPRALMAAAAAVIALGAGTAVVVQPWDESSEVQLSVADRIRAADDAETFTAQVDGATATVVRSQSLNQAVLVTDGMPDAPAGSVYELWLLHDDQMVSAGLMANGDHEVLLEGDPATATGFGITVEPDGGSEQPTSDPIALLDFTQA